MCDSSSDSTYGYIVSGDTKDNLKIYTYGEYNLNHECLHALHKYYMVNVDIICGYSLRTENITVDSVCLK